VRARDLGGAARVIAEAGLDQALGAPLGAVAPVAPAASVRVADHRDRAVARAAVGDARAAAALGIAAEIAEDLVLPAAPVFPADVVGAPVAAGAARGAGEARVGGGGVGRCAGVEL